MKKGFTLLEIIVSLGIFGVASMIAVSSLLYMIAAQRKAFNLQSTYDDLRYSIEVVTKEFRTGDVFHCGAFTGTIDALTPTDCPPPPSGLGGGASDITFINSQGLMIRYRYATKLINGATIGFMERSVSGGAFEQATGDNADLDDVRFYISGSRPSDVEFADTGYPFHAAVTMIVSGHTGIGKSRSQFSLQTTVAQRLVK